MKGKWGWFIGIIEACIGFVLFLAAQVEMSINSRYTWSRPYTSYEAQVIMIKWIGISFLVSGIIWLGLKYYQMKYTDKHTQEITPLTEKGGITKCLNCGLTLSADIGTCPRCGSISKNHDTNIGSIGNSDICYCRKCGTKMNVNDGFCSKCGTKISE